MLLIILVKVSIKISSIIIAIYPPLYISKYICKGYLFQQNIAVLTQLNRQAFPHYENTRIYLSYIM